MAGLDHRIIWELPGQSAFYPGTPGDPDFPDRFYSTDDPNNGSRVLYRGYGWWSIAVPGSNPIITYDWTQIPVTYGTTYDARTNGTGDAGGYEPSLINGTVGRQSGTLQTTQPGTSSLFTIGSGQMVNMGTVTVTTDGRVHCTAHGMANGQPVYFPTITGGVGLVAGPVSANLNQHMGWYVVASAAVNDFALQEMNPITGIFHSVAISTAYTSATLMKGLWLDQVDFKCYIQSQTNNAVGVALVSRSKIEGPLTPLTTVNGYFYNLSPTLVIIEADNEIVPQTPSHSIDASYGFNIIGLRTYAMHCSDGHGNSGGSMLFGRQHEKFMWIYPDPAHTDGTHNDAGMQAFGTGMGRMRGCAIWGLIDATVSTTTDPTGHPIPTFTVSAGLLTGTTNPQGYDFQRNNLRGGALYLNVSPAADALSLGAFFANQVSTIDPATRGGNPSVCLQVPSGSSSTFSYKMYVPISGVDANTNENGTPVNVRSAPGATFTNSM